MSVATIENAPRPKRWQFSLKTLLIVMLVASAVFGLVGRMYHEARIESWRVNNLRQIGIALYNYHDVWGCLPPAYLADSNGRPMHSWRVLILPFLEHVKLCEKYDFNEPWNGPNNSLLADQMPDCYRSPIASDAAEHQTVYVAAVGDGTMWPGAKGLRFHDVPDGLSNTILLLESDHEPVHWMEPKDTDYETTIAKINQECRLYGDELDLSRYRALFSDGSVQTIDSLVNDEEVEWYFLRNDGNLPGWR